MVESFCDPNKDFCLKFGDQVDINRVFVMRHATSNLNERLKEVKKTVINKEDYFAAALAPESRDAVLSEQGIVEAVN